MNEGGLEAIHRLVLRNGVYGVGARALTLFVGLLMTPYLLDRLGAERFAVWALASIVTGSLGLVDLGIRRALIHHVAEALGGGRRKYVSSLLSSALALYAGLAILLGFAAVALVPLAVRLLEIPGPLRGEARDVFLIASLSLVVGTALAAFPALCDGMQRMDVTNSLGAVWLVLGAAATIYAVENGLGLLGVALAQLASLSGFFVSTIPAGLLLADRLSISPRLVRREVVTSILGFGFQVHAAALAALAARHLDKLLLSRWAGLPFVTSYELGLKISGNAASLVEYLAAGLLPATSHLAASRMAHGLSPHYERALRFLALAGLPVFVFIFVEADVLVLAWLGPEAPAASASFARLLAAGYLAAAFGGAMSQICQGLGAPEIVLRAASLQLGANLALSLALLAWIGPFGAALGTTIALATGGLYLAARLHGLLGARGAPLVGGVLRAPLFAAAGAALLASFGGEMLFANGPTGRGSAIVVLAAEGCIFACSYAVAARHLTSELRWRFEAS